MDSDRAVSVSVGVDGRQPLFRLPVTWPRTYSYGKPLRAASDPFHSAGSCSCTDSYATYCLQELLSLGQQTREERQRAEMFKARKEESTRSRREELKQKFLRDQLAKKLGPGGIRDGVAKKDT